AVLPKYTDVKKDTWYSKDLAVVMSMGLVKGTSAKTVSPEKNVTGKEMMAMLVRSMGKEVKQSADSNWYDSYKKEAAALKLDEGIKFDVSKYLSRAEVAAMMYNYVKLNEKTLEKVDPNVLAQVKDMADIPAEYKEAVAYMYQKGLLKGYEDGSFMPNKSLTRVEAVIILARLLTI
ncbi:MAG: S-layer homology domain-containing protein, partial [Eubacteriales bacterium]